jgi:RNA polymerase sigma factor (sigma-70 family)
METPARHTIRLAAEKSIERLLDLSAPAYRVAMHVLGSAQSAEDVVQQAYLEAVGRVRSGPPLLDERTWFLKVVSNIAKDHQLREHRRLRKEAAVKESGKPAGSGAEGESSVAPIDSARGRELVEQLGAALASLEAKYRLPVVLCCQEGLSRREAAEILDLPERTVSHQVKVGLERLHTLLVQAGFTASAGVVLGVLPQAMPPVPATLAAAVGKIVSGEVAGSGSGAGSAGAAMGVVAKGGMAMKAIVAVVLAGTVAAGAAGLSAFGFRPSEPRETGGAPAAAAPAVGTNPVTGRQEREEVFEFAEKPKATKQGDKVIVTFASKGKCDATVAIVDKDGKIVRHLASGVLGANAPWPFQQNSLSQKLEWDGQDDRGKPAPAGCQVRVSLGLGAAYDFSMGENRLNFAPFAMVCNSQGMLIGIHYPIKNDLDVRVLTREGEYAATLAPFPATVSPEKLSTVAFATRWDGLRVPIVSNIAGGIYSGGGIPHRAGLSGLPRQTMQLTPDGKTLVFVTAGWRMGRYLVRMGVDGSMPKGCITLLNAKVGGEVQVGGILGNGDLHLAVSPDGQWIYFGSSVGGSRHVVYRTSLAQPGVPEVFLGEDGKPGADDAHFHMPIGVACDAENNLYVSDNQNGRIQVFAPDKRLLRSIKCPSPTQLAVHPGSGRIYVLQIGLRPGGGWANKAALATFDKDGNPAASMPVKPLVMWDAHHPPVFCLDSSAAEPSVWLMDQDGLKRYADKGAAFELAVDVPKLYAASRSWLPHPVNGGSNAGHSYITADPVRETIYVNVGGQCGGTPVMKIDGRTGKHIETIKSKADEVFYNRYDDTLYIRVENGGGVVKMNPADGKLIPFAKGVPVNWGRKNVEGGIAIPHRGEGRTFQDGFCVAPNGDVYVILSEAQNSFLEELRKIGQGAKLKPGNPFLPRGMYLQIYGPDGAVRHISALPGLDHCNGIHVTRAGKTMLGYAVYSVGAGPDGLAKGSGSTGLWGMLLQFDSEFGKFPIGKVHNTYESGPLAGPAPFKGSENRDCWVEPLRWSYNGMGPQVTAGGCVCGNSRFNLDGWERAWVPAVQTCSINVLDANGNVVTRIGRYGNADSKGADSPVVDPKTGLLRPRRAGDPAELQPPPELAGDFGFHFARYVAATDEAMYAVDTMGGGRIIRGKLTYKAEESVPLP